MPIRTHERLKNGDATVDVSTVRRWIRRCKEAEGLTSLTKRGVTAFYRAGIHALVKMWTKTVKMDGIILKSDKLIVNVVIFKLCNCIKSFLEK